MKRWPWDPLDPRVRGEDEDSQSASLYANDELGHRRQYMFY